MQSQFDELKCQQEVLLAKLKSYPRLDVAGSGMDARSFRNWFDVRDKISGRCFRFQLRRWDRLSSRRFEALLRCFLAECNDLS